MADSLYLDQIPVNTSPQVTDKLVAVRGTGVGAEILIPIENLPGVASSVSFTPTISANWGVQPATVQQALDTVSAPITATGVLSLLKYGYTTITSDYTLSGSEVIVMYTGTGGNIITLPNVSLHQNKVIFIMHDGTGTITLSGTIYRNGSTLSSLTLNAGDSYTVIGAYPSATPRWRII